MGRTAAGARRSATKPSLSSSQRTTAYRQISAAQSNKMPGSSLWLVPDPSHPLHALITKLIEVTLPAHFAQATPAPPKFAPHLTLTSNIDPSIYASDPQGWLDAIPFPGASEVNVEFERVKTEDVFFRRCYIKCGFEGVQRVAGLARARGVLGEEDIGEKTASWLAEWRASFGPHVSLL